MKTLALLAMLLLQGNSAAGDKGVVTGRLRTAEGLPAAGVRVAVTAVAEPGATPANTGAMLSIAETDKDGRYRLENIPPGRYYVTAGLVDTPTYFPGTLTPSGATIVQVLSGQTIEQPAFSMRAPAGLKVSGKIIIPFAPANAVPPQTIMMTGSPTGTTLSTSTLADGSFEFLRVPPGSYNVRTMSMAALRAPSYTLVVTDRDISGFQINLPFSEEVHGRIVLEDGNRFQNTSELPARIEARMPDWILVAPIAKDGTFRFWLTEGDYLLDLQNLPLGLSVKAISSGTSDLLRTPLRVLEGQTFKEIVVTVIAVPVNAVMVVHVNGRVIGLTSAEAVASRVNLLGEDSGQKKFQTTPNADGTFGFSGVPSGTYALWVSPGKPNFNTAEQRIYVGTDNVSGMELPVSINTAVPGRVPLVDTTAAISGVRVSGRVIGLTSAEAVASRVILEGEDAGMKKFQTTPNADGTFEFSGVPSGKSLLRIESSISNLGAGAFPRIYVGTDNISGIQIPALVRTTVYGRVRVVDANGRPVTDVMPSGSVFFRSGNGIHHTSLRPDGFFNIRLNEGGEQAVGVLGLSPQFTILSITAGSTDLMKAPLKVDGEAPPPEIEVRTEYRKQ